MAGGARRTAKAALVESVERAGRPVARTRTRARTPRVPRLAAVTLGVIAAAGLAYVAAHETSLFAARAVVVTGATPNVRAEVEKALAPFLRQSLVATDPDVLERKVGELPGVVAATVDRDFPHTLRVAVRPERAVAVIREGGDAWLVSARARVIAKIDPREEDSLPRIWLAGPGGHTPGTYLLPDEGGALITALARVPSPFPMGVEAARGTPDDLVLVLRGKTELRLGEARSLKLKMDVAAAVLRSLGIAQRRDLGYLDVSVPGRPVGAPKSQVSTSA